MEDKRIIIGTHSDSFHADDVYAVAILATLNPNYEVIRSRDNELLKSKCDYIVDVGGVYQPEEKIYDHHFNDSPSYDDNLPMSSVGLVWKHYGMLLCDDNRDVFDRVLLKFIKPLDANDSGVNLVTADNPYNLIEPTVSDIISIMNFSSEDIDKAFNIEVKRAILVLSTVIKAAQVWVKAKTVVYKAYQNAKENNQRFLEVPENCIWKEHLLEFDPKGEILYVIYNHNNSWKIKTVPVSANSFESRKLLPVSWAGLRDSELSEVIGVSDATFCHPSLFICGAMSRDSILKMVEKAVLA